MRKMTVSDMGESNKQKSRTFQHGFFRLIKKLSFSDHDYFDSSRYF